jgi:hypothetical protein
MYLQRHRFARSLGLLDGHPVYHDHCHCPSGILYISFSWGLKEFKCTISSSDILPSSPSDKFDSAGVDLRRLPENVSLAACKFSMHAFEAFRFCGMAENEDDECFQRQN